MQTRSTHMKAALIKQRQQQQLQEIAMIGYHTKQQYWSDNVTSKAAAVRYYELFHPEFTSQFIEAIVKEMETQLRVYNTEVAQERE